MPKVLTPLLELEALGSKCSAGAVAEVLRRHVDKWRREPKKSTLLLNDLAELGKAQVAVQVLKAMRHLQVPVNVFHLNVAIKACRRAKAPVSMALELLESAEQMQVRPDGVTFNAAISACDVHGDWEKAVGLLSDMAAFSPNEISYSAAISACEAAGEWAASLALLQDMLQAQLVHLPAFNGALSACARGSQEAKARQLLTEMGPLQLQADVISYNAGIRACEQSSSWQSALEILFGMAHASTPPDTVSFNTAISGCGKAGQWQRALQLLSLTPRPDVITYNAAISATAREGQWLWALQLFRDMKQRLKPDAYTHSSAISACARAAKWQMALQLLEGVPSTSAQNAAFSAALGACGEAALWRRAVQLLESMPRRQIQPDQGSFHAVAGAYAQAAQWQRARDLAQLLRTEVAFAAAMTAAERAGHWPTALALLAAMGSAELRADAVCFGAAINACTAWPMALQLLEDMETQAIQLNEVCLSAVVACAPWHIGLQLVEGLGEPGYGAAISACEGASQWVPALCLLSDMSNIRLALHTALVPALRACSAAGRWQEALSLTEHLAATPVDLAAALGIGLMECEQRHAMGPERALHRRLAAQPIAPLAQTALRWAARLRAAQRRQAPLALAPLVAELQRSPAGGTLPYHQAAAMLRHVVSQARAFDVDSIVKALDDFGQDLGWAKFAGGDKGEAMVAALRGCAPMQSDPLQPSSQRHAGVLEIGTYWGNSAMRLASALGKAVPITSLELDPVHVAVARCLLAFAGCSSVTVCTGHSQQLLPRFSSCQAVLMDRWGSEYEEDLDMLQKLGLVKEGTLVVADNVLTTAAAGYLWKTGPESGGPARFASVLVAVQEVVDQSEDWLSVSLALPAAAAASAAASAEPAEPPPGLRELQRRSEATRRLVVQKGGEVAAEEMPQLRREALEVLAQHGFAASLDKTCSVGPSHIATAPGTRALPAPSGFLNNLDLGPQENFIARNSILAEYAVVGFELGYSYENPTALVVWEAQFGDFANTAQVMTDQFISAGEHKWLQQSGLVMLLPHGYMGQGAEHSSCRIERFLQSSDDDEDDIPDFADGFGRRQVQKANWQVMNLSTPANYFHALRRQQHRDFRKPMVVASPKNLFRLRQCVSPLADMELDTRFQRLINERDPEIAAHPDKVERLIFCSGKIYYELAAERERLGLKNVAIITLEQLAPFPFDRVKEVMSKFSAVDEGDGVHPGQIIWCQEEPKNMGPWSYVRPRFVTTAREGFHTDLVMRYIGRRAAASPATGYPKLHAAEQEAILREALLGTSDARAEDNYSVQRPSPLLGHQT
ncbi:unnamed protein product [Effrenium voratum]|nr:unnamed protein product [Effrenium voratum]